MTTLEFSAMACDKRLQKVLSVASPTLRSIAIKRATIKIDTESEPSEKYIKDTIRLIESHPISGNVYLENVKLVRCTALAYRRPPEKEE